MQCPRCGCNNVRIQAVTNVTTKNRGCFGWLLWIILACLTCGLILIIPAVTNSKTKSRTDKVAICQNCGYSWRI